MVYPFVMVYELNITNVQFSVQLPEGIFHQIELQNVLYSLNIEKQIYNSNGGKFVNVIHLHYTSGNPNVHGVTFN